MFKKGTLGQSLLNESFYKQRTKQGEFNSLKFVQKYLAKHGIDTLLTSCFQKMITNKQLPRNPYAGIYRDLTLSIFRKNLEQYFEEVQDRKMITNRLSPGSTNPNRNRIYPERIATN